LIYLRTGHILTLYSSPPTDAFQKYQQATGAQPDQATGLLKISQTGYDNLESLFFNIGGEQHELTRNAQIWPRAANTAIGGAADGIYLIVADVRVIFHHACLITITKPVFGFYSSVLTVEEDWTLSTATHSCALSALLLPWTVAELIFSSSTLQRTSLLRIR
jgi:hypothetical protein